MAVLVFDYDGTIHDTLRIYEPSFRRAYEWLVQEGYTKRQEISSTRISSWLGLNKYEMWNSFLPGLPDDILSKASDLVGNSMLQEIESHRALWYRESEAMLDALKADGHTMVLLSNCRIAYARAHWREFAMERWFDRFYACEEFAFAPKTEIIHQIRDSYPGEMLVIGDRKSDLDCARAAGSPFIGCVYGFGTKEELQDAEYLAPSPLKITDGIR